MLVWTTLMAIIAYFITIMHYFYGTFPPVKDRELVKVPMQMLVLRVFIRQLTAAAGKNNFRMPAAQIINQLSPIIIFRANLQIHRFQSPVFILNITSKIEKNK